MTSEEKKLWQAIFWMAMQPFDRICPICREYMPRGTINKSILEDHLKAKHPELLEEL